MSLPSNIQSSLEDQRELSEPDYDLWEEGRQHDELEDEQRHRLIVEQLEDLRKRIIKLKEVLYERHNNK